jgi:DNA polymerase-3 subunit gamma/tau
LAEIVGQGHITDALSKAIAAGKVGHAYLFVGPRGTGKTSVARILAHEINGFEYQLEDDHLDIIEIDAASNTGVDNIRDLREKAIIAPTRGKYKVYIIDEVHMLSKSAFNALLKTLEEPPAHVVFIMATTDAHKVPVTITSRSQTFAFKLADADTMRAHLRKIADAEEIKISDEALGLVVRRGGGSFRDAISLLDQVSLLAEGEEITGELIERALGLPQDDLVKKLYQVYLEGDAGVMAGLVKQLAEQGVKPEIVAEELMAKIVEEPRMELFGLLEKLADIPRAAYPEVKLLLALMPRGASVGNMAQTPSSSQATKPPKEPASVSPDADDEGRVLPVAEELDSPTKEDQDSVKTLTETPVPQDNPVEFSWDRVLSGMRGEAGVYKYVVDADYEVTGNKLIIYAKKTFAKNQIEKKRVLILANLPEGMELEVLATVKNIDTTIANIAELMGGGEEVSL